MGPSFAAALGAAPPLAFGALEPDARRASERRWWREVVGRTVAASATSPDVSRADAGSASPVGDGPQLDAFFDDLFAAFARPEAWSVLSGAREVLAELARRRYRLGVLSNFDTRLPDLLAGLGLAGHLALIATSSELGYAKPDARSFGAALARLGEIAARSAYVGDTPATDAAGAASAGLLPVLLGAPLPPGVAGFEISGLADLLDLFSGPAA